MEQEVSFTKTIRRSTQLGFKLWFRSRYNATQHVLVIDAN